MVLGLLFTLIFTFANAEEIESAAMPDTKVLEEGSEENLREVIGPKLPKDYFFLKKNREPGKPVNFDFLKSGGKLLPAKFVYNVTNKGVQIGPILFRPKYLNFKARLRDRERDFVLEWPGHLPQAGRLQIMQGETKVVWSREFDKWDVGERLLKVNVKSKINLGKNHYYRWFEKKVDEELFDFVKKNSKDLKYCVFFEGEGYKHSLCAPLEKAAEKVDADGIENWEEKASDKTNEKNNSDKDIVVTVNDRVERPKGIIVVGLESDTLSFKANLAKGFVMEITTKPILFEIFDTMRTPEKILIIRARGATPYEENVKFFEDGSWETKVKNFRLYVSGAGEIPFYQELFVNQQLPSQEERIKTHSRSHFTTYANNTMLYGYVPKTATISSVNGSANKYESEFFTWNVDRLEKGKVSKPNIGISYGNRNYEGVAEVYRGYQLEVGARLSGVAVVQNQQLLLLSDFVLNYWSETFFGSKNYWLGHQRWGIKLKYLRGMTKVDLLDRFASAHADIAYRLTPGIWERDATFGVLLGVQSATVNDDSVPMIGGGAFWARSMPSFIDRIFNLVPWFRYPKWVDMEFLYYFMTTDSRYQLGSNFLYNFHGKMLITPRFYLEGGGTVRQINYAIVDSGQTPLNAAFVQGTFGIGYNF